MSIPTILHIFPEVYSKGPELGILKTRISLPRLSLLFFLHQEVRNTAQFKRLTPKAVLCSCLLFLGVAVLPFSNFSNGAVYSSVRSFCPLSMAYKGFSIRDSIQVAPFISLVVAMTYSVPPSSNWERKRRAATSAKVTPPRKNIRVTRFSPG